MRSLIFVLLAGLPLSSAIGQEQQAAATKAFQAAFDTVCYLDAPSAGAETFPTESWQLEWFDEVSDTLNVATLYQFFCSAGAYNVQYVYYLENQWGELLPLSIAVPQFDVEYADNDIETAVSQITVRGFTTQMILTNSSFNPDTNTITNTGNWRGLGDASSGGVWAFEGGQFVLKSFDVDASYDGEINPKRLVEYE